MNIPITLIIDDPAPLVNVFWWHAAERQNTDAPTQQSGEPIVRDVPVDFLRECVDVFAAWNVKGKFSVLPYPAGLGKISEGWQGCDQRALEEWLTIARNEVTQLMDITPEILTHAKTLDLDTMTLLPENERDWAAHQTEATLTPYIARAPCASSTKSAWRRTAERRAKNKGEGRNRRAKIPPFAFRLSPFVPPPDMVFPARQIRGRRLPVAGRPPRGGRVAGQHRLAVRRPPVAHDGDAGDESRVCRLGCRPSLDRRRTARAAR